MQGINTLDLLSFRLLFCPSSPLAGPIQKTRGQGRQLEPLEKGRRGLTGPMTDIHKVFILCISLWSGHPDLLSWVFVLGLLELPWTIFTPETFRPGRPPLLGVGAICGGAPPSRPARSPLDRESEVWGADPGPWFHPPLPGPSPGSTLSLLAGPTFPYEKLSWWSLGAGRPGCLLPTTS